MTNRITGRTQRVARICLGAVLALVLLAVVPGSARAGIREHWHSYFAGFYGQDFYDGQPHHKSLFHGNPDQQHRQGIYGPPMIYGRQYVDQYVGPTDPPATRRWFHPHWGGSGR